VAWPYVMLDITAKRDPGSVGASHVIAAPPAGVPVRKTRTRTASTVPVGLATNRRAGSMKGNERLPQLRGCTPHGGASALRSRSSASSRSATVRCAATLTRSAPAEPAACSACTLVGRTSRAHASDEPARPLHIDHRSCRRSLSWWQLRPSSRLDGTGWGRSYSRSVAVLQACGSCSRPGSACAAQDRSRWC